MKLLLVGCGKMGMHHLRAAVDLGVDRFITAVDPSPSSESLRLLNDLSVPVADRLEPLLLSGGWSGAVVASSVFSHLAVTEALSEHGIPVLLEKPLGGSLAGWIGLQQKAVRRGVLLIPAFTERSHLAWERALSFLPKIGRVIGGGTVRVSPHHWRPSGVDPLSDLAIHDLEHLASLFPSAGWRVSKPTGRSFGGGGRSPEGDGDTGVGAVEEESLCRVMLTPDPADRRFAPGATFAVEGGWKEIPDGVRKIEIVGERGNFSIDWATGVWRAEVDGMPLEEERFPNDSVRRQLRWFLRLIENSGGATLGGGGEGETRGETSEVRHRLRSATEAMELMELARDHFDR